MCIDSALVYAWARGRARRACESPRLPPGAVRGTDPGPVRAGPAPRLKRNLGSNRAAEGAEERTRRRLPSPAEGLPGSWEKFSHGGVGSQEWAPLAPRIFPRPSAPPPRSGCLLHLHPHQRSQQGPQTLSSSASTVRQVCPRAPALRAGPVASLIGPEDSGNVPPRA